MRARIHNNLAFQRAQQQVFSTINRMDKLVAYSIATSGGGESLARIKMQQVRALVNKFQVSNIGSDPEEERR